MNASRALSFREAEHARRLLDRERESLALTGFQKFCYWSFNAVAMGLLVGLIALAALSVANEIGLGEWTGSSELLLGFAVLLAILLGGLGVLLIPLFLCNLPLARRFWQLARLRRRIGLVATLDAEFRFERRRSRLRNVLTGLGALAGVALVVFGLVSWAADHLENHQGFEWDALLGLLILLLYGASLISLHYLRRGKERLAVVNELLASLTGEGEGEASDTEVSIPSDSYERVARFERERILMDRRRSIHKAPARTELSRFSLQRSASVQPTLEALDEARRVQVERVMLSLLDEPEPEEASFDEATGLYRLHIEESPLDLVYELDERQKRVRIHEIDQP